MALNFISAQEAAEHIKNGDNVGFSGFTASGTPIRVGEEVAVRGKGFAGYGFVIDLKTVTK